MKYIFIIGAFLIMTSSAFAQNSAEICPIKFSWNIVTVSWTQYIVSWSTDTENYDNIVPLKDKIQYIIKEYQIKRQELYNQKKIIKEEMLDLYKEIKETKENEKKSELKKDLGELKNLIWYINAQTIYTYGEEYKERFEAKK